MSWLGWILISFVYFHTWSWNINRWSAAKVEKTENLLLSKNMIPFWRILNVYLLIDPACWLGGISARCSASYVGILVDFLTWTICFRPFHNISVRLRSRLWLGHFKTLTFSSTIFFLSVERLVCLGAFSSSMTNLFLRFSSWTDVLTFLFRLYQDHSEFIV